MRRDRSNDPPRTAAELMAELREDPDYIARMQQRESVSTRTIKNGPESGTVVQRDRALLKPSTEFEIVGSVLSLRVWKVPHGFTTPSVGPDHGQRSGNALEVRRQTHSDRSGHRPAGAESGATPRSSARRWGDMRAGPSHDVCAGCGNVGGVA